MADAEELTAEIVAGIDALFAFSPSGSYYERCAALDVPTVVVAAENTVDADDFVALPIEFEDTRERIRFGVEGALDAGVVGDGDTVACTLGLFDDETDTLVRREVDEDNHTGIYDLFANSRANPEAIRDVFEVAIELGNKGQKGKNVGALFVVGDAGKVMNSSRALSYNPFEKSHVHVGDPIVNVMLKEFSRLDGAFVISDEGKIVSAYRYLEPAAAGIDIPKGLGARHMAAAAITRDTNAVSVVLSESDAMVRAFKRGELILEIDPEAY
jgi:DNA integrity scanning protein DisA with diadenylate cyclase activity